ncbi:hypothetical protein GCM10028808_73300 [Spirosoma migulaei]
MAKAIKDLKPSDKVMVEFGPRQSYDEDSGELIVIEKKKRSDVPYSYYLAVTKHEDEYNAKTGFCKPLGRYVKLLGTAEYTQEKTDSGDTFEAPVVVPFLKAKPEKESEPVD